MKRIGNRCYFRGTSWLGLLNTVLGCLFNRVRVKVVDSDTKYVLGWRWGKGTDFPPLKDGSVKGER